MIEQDLELCTLSIMVARTDIPFMMHTIPHLVRSCGGAIQETLLLIDTAPLSPNYRKRPGIGTLQELRRLTDQLVSSGIASRAIDINYSPTFRKRVYQKHFGVLIRETHNYRGYPVLGSVAGIEEASHDWVLHFDSDMLCHCDPGYNWISEGMKLINEHADIMFISPLSGPPRRDGRLLDQEGGHELDQRGLHKMGAFTSRKYLVNRRKLDQHLPMRPLWISRKRRILGHLTRRSALWNWEIIVDHHLKARNLIRGDLASTGAWTLHTPDHGPDFIQQLPEIIKRVESGDVPSAQRGHYDLYLRLWQQVN